MYHRRIVFFALACFVAIRATAQETPGNACFYSGAGYAGTAAFNNPALLIEEKTYCIISQNTSGWLSETATGWAAASLRRSSLQYSVGVKVRGYSSLRIVEPCVAFSLQASAKWSVGVRLNHCAWSFAEGYGTYRAQSVDVGWRMSVTPKLHLAAWHRRLWSSVRSDRSIGPPPALIMGAVYRVSNQLYFGAQCTMHRHLGISPAVHLRYSPRPAVAVYCGVLPGEERLIIGTSVRFAHWRAELACSIHSILGPSPLIACVYQPSH
jgi:hypothetical protein